MNKKRTFSGIIKELNEVIVKNNLETKDFLFSDVKTDLKKTFIRNRIDEFNTLKLNKHGLQEGYNDQNKELSNMDNLNDITLYIADFFAGKTKKDRIKEIDLSLKLDKVFKDSRYFSMYDVRKSHTVEEFKTKIINKCKKEIVLNVYGISSYGYLRQESYIKLIECLNLILGTNYEITYKDLGQYDNLCDIQARLNELKGVKFRIYGEWLYISFEDAEKQKVLMDYLLNKEVEYFERQ